LKSGLLIGGTLAISMIGRFSINRYEKHIDKKHNHLSVEEVISDKEEE
jgi:hypothetical protein